MADSSFKTLIYSSYLLAPLFCISQRYLVVCLKIYDGGVERGRHI